MKKAQNWVGQNCKFAAEFHQLLQTPVPAQPANTPWMQKEHPKTDTSIDKLTSAVEWLYYNVHTSKFHLDDAMKKNEADKIKPLQDQLKLQIPALVKGMLKLVRRMDEISLANYEKPYPDLNMFYQKLGDIQKAVGTLVAPDQLGNMFEVIETLHSKLNTDAKGLHILNKAVYPNNEAFKDVAPPTDLKHNPSGIGDTNKIHTRETPLPNYVRAKP